MKKNKYKLKIIAVVAVALIATIVTYSVLSKLNNQIAAQAKLINLMQSTQTLMPQGNFTYAVVTKSLKAGEMLTNDDIEFRTFAVENPDAFKERDDVLNKILLNDIEVNQIITSTHIARPDKDGVLPVRTGYRALTFAASSFTGKSPGMVKGSYVDVFTSSKSDNWHAEGLRIIGIEKKPDDGTEVAPAPTAGAPTPQQGTNTTANANDEAEKIIDVTKAKNITFEVPATQVADFIDFASKGSLVLVARNPGEVVKKVSTKPASTSNPHSSSTSFPKSSGSFSSLPNLPSTPAIEGLDGLPTPLSPEVAPIEVEIIKANEKTKVTF